MKKIKNSSVEVGKIAGKGFLKSILFTGICLLLFVIGLFLSMTGGESSSGTTAAGHTGLPGLFVAVFYFLINDFWPTLLCIVSLLVFPFVYNILIKKGVLRQSLYQLWKTNLEAWFVSKINALTEKFFSGNNKASLLDDKATLKLRYIKDIKEDKNTSRLHRKIFAFILKKIKLDDFDATQPDAKLSQFIVNKATHYVSEIGAPDKKPLYIALGIHLTFLILALIFNK